MTNMLDIVPFMLGLSNIFFEYITDDEYSYWTIFIFIISFIYSFWVPHQSIQEYYWGQNIDLQTEASSRYK